MTTVIQRKIPAKHRIAKTQLPQVIKVTALQDFILEIHFNTGEHGRLPLAKHLPFTGYFAPLAQAKFFNQVYIDHGTLCWPGDIDLDPVVLHAWTLNLPVELATPINT
jgi:Protein of unknown function (DUF2442)